MIIVTRTLLTVFGNLDLRLLTLCFRLWHRIRLTCHCLKCTMILNGNRCTAATSIERRSVVTATERVCSVGK